VRRASVAWRFVARSRSSADQRSKISNASSEKKEDIPSMRGGLFVRYSLLNDRLEGLAIKGDTSPDILLPASPGNLFPTDPVPKVDADSDSLTRASHCPRTPPMLPVLACPCGRSPRSLAW
jgi:hypothetical protein